MTKTHRFWHIATSVIAVIVLVSAGARIKAYLLHAQSESSAPAVSEAAPAAQSKSAEATEPKSGESKSGESAEKEAGGLKSQIYLWINFLLIVAAFWYLSKNQLGPFLRSRGEAIREDMRLSSQALQDASARLAAVEQKLERLDQEIASLRSSALQEAAAERARIEVLAKADAGKIAQAAEQEIAAASKLARQELRAYAAELAVGLAEKRIQESISAEAERGIFRTFIADLSDGAGWRASGRKPRNGGA